MEITETTAFTRRNEGTEDEQRRRRVRPAAGKASRHVDGKRTPNTSHMRRRACVCGAFSSTWPALGAGRAVLFSVRPFCFASPCEIRFLCDLRFLGLARHHGTSERDADAAIDVPAV